MAAEHQRLVLHGAPGRWRKRDKEATVSAARPHGHGKNTAPETQKGPGRTGSRPANARGFSPGAQPTDTSEASNIAAIHGPGKQRKRPLPRRERHGRTARPPSPWTGTAARPTAGPEGGVWEAPPRRREAAAHRTRSTGRCATQNRPKSQQGASLYKAAANTSSPLTRTIIVSNQFKFLLHHIIE